MNCPYCTYPHFPGSKTTGTSEQAAVSVKSRVAQAREAILELLRAKPMTADEVAEVKGWTQFFTRPRFSELRKLGKIEDAGVRRKNESGASANVWKAVDLL